MDMTTKLAVCDMRLDGASVYEIAMRFQVTPQSIHNFVSTFPYEAKRFINPNCGKDMMINVCQDYIKGSSVEEISENFGLTDSEINAIFNCISRRKSVRLKNTLYPVLTDWMRDNGWTVKDLAGVIGMSPQKLGAIISGKNKGGMPYDLAKQIQKITGLSFSDIFKMWK